MARRLIRLSCALVFTWVFGAGQVAAQPLNGTAGMTAQEMGPRQQVATIIFAGLAGAILGLSTLSFYGRPQDKLSNIAIGFAVGVISGTVYTSYKAVTRPYRPYENVMAVNLEPGEFNPWATEYREMAPNVAFTWSF